MVIASADKAFDKIQHLITIKALNILGIEGTFLNLIKSTHRKSHS